MSILQELTSQLFNKWPKNLYKELSWMIFSTFIFQIFQVNLELNITHNYLTKFSISVLRNMLPGKSWNLWGAFRNFSTKLFGGLDSKISIDLHVCNKLLRLSWKVEAKIMKNIRCNCTYTSFWSKLQKNWHVNSWTIDLSIVSSC